jgi:hypothetical protein
MERLRVTGPPSDPDDAATPLTDAERMGLRLPVLTRADLNRPEADNISRAMTWLFLSQRRLRPELVTSARRGSATTNARSGSGTGWSSSIRSPTATAGGRDWHRMLIVALRQ